MASGTEPEIFKRLMRYAGKKRGQVSNPCITANEAIELANYVIDFERYKNNFEAAEADLEKVKRAYEVLEADNWKLQEEVKSLNNYLYP